MNNTDKIQQATVILSGPTRGVGHAIFNQLLSRRYPTIGLGRNLGRIADLASNAAQPVQLVDVDLCADYDTLMDVLAEVRRILSIDRSGPVVFISNASIIEPIVQATELMCSGFEKAMRINCVAPLLIANYLTKTAQDQGRHMLVLDVSSGAALRPIRGWQAYCTSKAAYKMGLDVLAAENTHIQVVHFDPGVMDTSMQDLIRAQHVKNMPEVDFFRAYQKNGTLKAPVEVAAAVINLIEQKLS